MNTMTNKGIAYISYKNNDGTTNYGTFEDIPMNAFLGTIHLEIPYVDTFGEIQTKEYIHRIYCGDDIPTEIFLKAYGKTLSKEKLDYIKLELEQGHDAIVIPLSRSNEFAFLTKEDQLCRTRDEFENIILDFKNKTNDILDFIVPGDETPKNIM